MKTRTSRVGIVAIISLAAAVAAGAQTERIHAVGYSITYNTICGTTGLFFVTPGGEEGALYHEYGGGTAPVWWEQIGSPPGLKWQIFRYGIEINGVPRVVFWQVGFHLQASSELTSGELQALFLIADTIRSLAPGAIIYVSGMSGYTPFVCERINRKAIEKSWNAAGILWGSAPDIRMGPTLPDITPEETAGSGDLCHLGPLGKTHHGQRLQDFFDGVLAELPPGG